LDATESLVREALLGVSDPEYPMSIVDLGLVYDVHIQDGVAHIDITFTSIGCPAIEMIVEDIHSEVGPVPGIDRVEVEVVWGPPWTKDKITKRGRRVLVAYGVAV
jgi:phenylacetate-CoA oxygenase PaaJ subunit